MSVREEILQPIPGDTPSGQNLYYSPLFDKIKEARRQDLGGPMGAWEREVKTADYPLVIKQCEDALATQTKDLWLAVWLTEALIWRDKFAGLRDGLQLVSTLLETFWETLHPAIEEGDAELRAAPIEWLGNYLEPEKGMSPALAIQFVALNKQGLHYIQYKDSQAVGYEESVKANEQRKKSARGSHQRRKGPAGDLRHGAQGNSQGVRSYFGQRPQKRAGDTAGARHVVPGQIWKRSAELY